MKLILCINNETLLTQEIADMEHKTKDYSERVSVNSDYVKLMIMALKVRYQRVLQTAPYEIYLVCESRMNKEKSFLEKVRAKLSPVCKKFNNDPKNMNYSEKFLIQYLRRI